MRLIFFFKQKTAYEMRISDWSSDVCSSDLLVLIDTTLNPPPQAEAPAPPRRAALVFIFITVVLDVLALGVVIPVLPHLIEGFTGGDIGSADRTSTRLNSSH